MITRGIPMTTAMQTLVINAGSSSIKFQVFKDETSLLQGVCEEIGSDRSKLKIKINGTKQEMPQPLADHKEALEAIIAALDQHGIKLDDIDVVTHRTVHGGEAFRKTTFITPEVIAKLKELIPLAPLHNPPNILCAELMMQLAPHAKQVAVFDTAYHSTLPEKAYLYGIPYKYYKKHGIRKYGFHGSSHKYVVGEALKLIGNPDAKIISCHLGNGVSICATKAGISLDTSMGFTPLQGSIMGTRSGLIDPAIVPFLMHAEDITSRRVDRILNKESGLLGLSEISSDHRLIEEEMAKGNPNAKRAHDVFCYRLVKLIGGYVAALNGVDAIVFTGGIGEKSAKARADILQQFSYVGIEVDPEANTQHAQRITKDGCAVCAFVIPTNEELQMVRNAKTLLKETSA